MFQTCRMGIHRVGARVEMKSINAVYNEYSGLSQSTCFSLQLWPLAVELAVRIRYRRSAHALMPVRSARLNPR